MHHEKSLVPVFFKVSVYHLFGEVESRKINYCFRRKPAKSLELWIQKSVRNLSEQVYQEFIEQVTVFALTCYTFININPDIDAVLN